MTCLCLPIPLTQHTLTYNPTALKKKLNTVTAAIQGSGWGWLGYNPDTKKLEVVTTANQDPLLSHVPIVGIDIWEHAFYLQYQNVKVDVSIVFPASNIVSSALVLDWS